MPRSLAWERTRNQRLAQQLGMPSGTAMTKLRKIILFHLLKKHGENVCTRCNLEIVVVGDLSIEHIKPWENIDPALFWDLDNIAFSHIKCNRPHSWGRKQISIAGRIGFKSVS